MSMLGLKVYYDENKPLVVQICSIIHLNNMLYVDMKASRALTRCAALK